jgi:hypothetical protein
MYWIDVVSRITHVLTAILLLGGSLYSLLVMRPLLISEDSEVRQRLSAKLTGQWKRFIHGGILLFLLSGFYNYFRAMPAHKGDGAYHALIGIKMLLAFGLFFLAAALVGRSPKLQTIRHENGWALKLICVLGIIIVIISGYLKISGSVVAVSIQESIP